MSDLLKIQVVFGREQVSVTKISDADHFNRIC